MSSESTLLTQFMIKYLSSTPTPFRSVKRNNVSLPKQNLFASVGLALVLFTLNKGAGVPEVFVILTCVINVN